MNRERERVSARAFVSCNSARRSENVRSMVLEVRPRCIGAGLEGKEMSATGGNTVR